MAEEMTKGEAIERLKSARARARDIAKRSARLGTTVILAGAGGAVAGFLDLRFPYLPGTAIPTTAAIGLLLVGAAAADMFDADNNDRVTSFASGMLATIAARQVQKMYVAQQTARTGVRPPVAV